MSAVPLEQRVELGYTPRPHQRAAHRALKRFSVLVWHRRSGKTVFAVMELVLEAAGATRDNWRGGYIAPFYRQAKAVAWMYLVQYSRRIPGVTVNESELSVSFPNGAVIRLFGADNPDALRGLYFDLVVCDEVAQFRPQVWGEILRPALADRGGRGLIIGTPQGLNLFSKLYHAAREDADWYVDVKRVQDTDALEVEEQARMRREMTDTEWAQEMECDFGAANADSVIPLHLAQSAQGKLLETDAYYYAPVVLGVDVARYGDSRTVICRRQGRAVFPLVTLRGLSVTETASQVARQINEHQPRAVFVDAGGVGGGVVDVLRTMGYTAIGVDFGSRPLEPRFANKRAEMWWSVREWLADSGVLPRDQGLLEDLSAPTYWHSRNDGKITIESKDEMRERGLPSPDAADALALTFAEPIPISVDPTLDIRRQSFATCDYDPWRNR